MPMASPVPWRCLVTVAGLLCVVFPVVASTGGRQSGSAVFGTAEGLEYSSVPSSTCSVKISLPNRALHNFAKQASTPTSDGAVKQFVHLLSKQLTGIKVKSNIKVCQAIHNRIKHVERRVKVVRTSGRKLSAFLESTWELCLNKTDYALVQKTSPTKEKLKQENVKLREQVSRLSARALQMGATPGRGKAKDKSPHTYSSSHLRLLKRQRKEKCLDSLAWLQSEGYKVRKIELENEVSGNVEEIQVEDLLGTPQGPATQDDFDIINMLVYVKDAYNVSGQAYHELTQICQSMPRHYHLKRRIKELNSLWKIWPTPHNTCGVQQSLKDRLTERTRALVKSTSDDADFKKSKCIRVKISGDGTNIGKRLHVINVTFTLLDEGSQACSARGNHIIAMLKEPESYEQLKLGLEDIVAEINSLHEIEVEGIKLSVSFYLGGDWKFLAVVTGIDSASSTYACIWCKCPSFERHDMSKEWSIVDAKKGARSLKENLEIAGRPKSKRSYNVSHPPIFPIALHNTVIDNLHLFLRVSDTLTDLLIRRMLILDSVDKVKAWKKIDRTKCTYLSRFENMVKELGISSYTFWVGRDSKKLKWRTLTGPEKLKLFNGIDMTKLFPPGHELILPLQKLWKDFLMLHSIFSCKPGDTERFEQAQEFSTKAQVWLDDFLTIYQTKNVTPYIHAMVCHVQEFINLHGTIAEFTQQGLEKLNDYTTKDYFWSSSHQGLDALMQIVQKPNRMEYMEDYGYKRETQVTKCSLCHTPGHNKCTCSQRNGPSQN